MAELLLRRGLEGVSGIEVESAGIAAVDGARMCDLAAGQYEDAAWGAAVSEHRSRRVTDSMLRLSTLVLVTDREVRSGVVRAAPEIRDRVFTLRDAARLVQEVPLEAAALQVGAVSRLAMHLDRNRAVRGVRLPARGFFAARRREDPSSIIDGHVVGLRKHRVALDEVVLSAGAILAALAPGVLVREWGDADVRNDRCE